MKSIQIAAKYLDFLLSPLVLLAALMMKLIRRMGLHRLPICKRVLFYVGIFPIRDHYYEPKFNHMSMSSLHEIRFLPGIKWNLNEQLDFLEQLRFKEELEDIPFSADLPDNNEFHFNNGSFESGDAEYWYQIIRLVRPQNIIEIGSGNSTKLAIAAMRRNKAGLRNQDQQHICIEPYEQPWLESAEVTVVREKVEKLSVDFFGRLKKNDILFIDSSHMIRPQGDICKEYLEILPSLNSGVIVHIHDIFSPRDYPREWLQDHMKFWNEQYLLEAFLTHNSEWKILGALNYLCHEQFDHLKRVCPYLEKDREPGSFYIQKL